MSVGGTVQEKIAKEVEDLAKKKLGPDATITFEVRHDLVCSCVCVCDDVVFLLGYLGNSFFMCKRKQS